MSRAMIFGVEPRYLFDVLECLELAGIELVGCVAYNPDNPIPEDVPKVVALDALSSAQLALPVVVPVQTPGYRKANLAKARAAGFKTSLSVVHPSAVVSKSAELGNGAMIHAGVIIGANCSFGEQLSLNRGASIGHHGQVGDFVSFGPGAVACGDCRIARGVFIGAGATILPRLTLGANSVIGAGAVVTKDVAPNTVVVGNPARVVKRGVAGYRDTDV